MTNSPEDPQGPWQAWVDELNALPAGEQRAASSQVVLSDRNSVHQLERNIREAQAQAHRRTWHTTDNLPQHTNVVMPLVELRGCMHTPTSAQDERTTCDWTKGSVMTWALSQELVWQWQDDAGGWVNMHESWMPQLTELKNKAGGAIWLRHDWKQRNGSTRVTWYNVDVNAMMQTSQDNGKTRRVRALAQILPWAGDTTASSQAKPDFTEHTAGGWPRDASGASCSGHPPETSSQSQRMPMPSPPPPPPPPAPYRDASQQTENVMEASQQPAPANTGLSALQPARQIADDEESVVLV